jgi:hypothetical protein
MQRLQRKSPSQIAGIRTSSAANRSSSSGLADISISSTATSGNPPSDYAAAVRRPAALCPALKQAVVSAVYVDYEDHDRRSKNIIVNGFRYDGDHDKRNVEKLLADEFSMSATPTQCRRLGRRQSGRIQPLLVKLL